MEFNEKLQNLRKQKGLTQEELAESLYVSRTAISKWESGRGYPNIESLKLIAKTFSVTIDELLSGEELLDIAEQDNKKKDGVFCDLLFGLMDIFTSLLLFLPFFAEKLNGAISEVSLLALLAVAPYLKTVFLCLVVTIILFGILTLALQNYTNIFWQKIKTKTSLILNFSGVLLFIISLQPYAATFLLMFLIIKVFMLARKR